MYSAVKSKRDDGLKLLITAILYAGVFLAHFSKDLLIFHNGSSLSFHDHSAPAHIETVSISFPFVSATTFPQCPGDIEKGSYS